MCPVCRGVVDGQEEHVTGWHEPLSKLLAFTSAAPTDAPEPAPGGLTWGGPPVAPPPDPPSDVEAGVAADLRAQAAQAFAAYEAAMPLLDDYLAAVAVGPPTPEAVTAQVQNLTNVTRGLVLAVRDLIRLSARALGS